jgi:hypothetical protein
VGDRVTELENQTGTMQRIETRYRLQRDIINQLQEDVEALQEPVNPQSIEDQINTIMNARQPRRSPPRQPRQSPARQQRQRSHPYNRHRTPLRDFVNPPTVDAAGNVFQDQPPLREHIPYNQFSTATPLPSRNDRYFTPAPQPLYSQHINHYGAPTQPPFQVQPPRHSRPPTGKEPEIFRGTSKEDFLTWKREIEGAVYLRRTSFQTAEETIIFIASYLQGSARTFFQDYQDTIIRTNGVWDVDQFLNRMQRRFKANNLPENALKKIKALVYKGDIDNLVETFRILARRAQLSGPPLRDMLKAVLPYAIKSRISIMEPTEDDDTWLNNVIMAGRGQEELQEDNRRTKTTMQGALPQGSLSNQEKRFKSIEEATKGVPQAVVKSRMEKKACARCGMQNHNAYFCRRREPVVTMASLGSGFPLFPIPDNQENNNNTNNNDDDEDDQEGVQLNALDYLDGTESEQERTFLLESDEHELYPGFPSINSKEDF